jgi:rhodanese-related sulfurtransferase
MSTQSSFASIPEVDVEVLASYLADQTTNVQLVDVREPQEIAIASLEKFANLPLSQFPEWSDPIQNYLDPHTETIVMCHHGLRSAQVCQWLLSQGFTNVKNLSGGIDAYSIRVDPSIPRY